MKYTIPLLVCIFMFAQCRKAKNVQAFTTTDTLGIHWLTIEKPNITYCFQSLSGRSDNVNAYIDAHESAYTTINKVFQAKLPQKLRFFVWTDATLAAQLLHASLGFTVPQQCVCYVRPDQTVGHEMTHALSYWAWGITPTTVTRFINEGIAVAFDLEQDNKIETAKAAISGANLNSVLDLWPGNNYSEEILYPVAGAFVQYLYQQSQPAQFDSLVKNQDLTSAQKIYGPIHFNNLVTDFNKLIGL